MVARCWPSDALSNENVVVKVTMVLDSYLIIKIHVVLLKILHTQCDICIILFLGGMKGWSCGISS